MAALAQVVNVLQAVILTEGDKMIKTPTYHVMHMYRYHQDADLLLSALTDEGIAGVEGIEVPKLTESVSQDKDGVITVTVNNLSATDSEEVEMSFVDAGYKVIESRIVTADDMQAYNTFEEMERVVEKDFTDYSVKESAIQFNIPKTSVVMMRLKK